MSASEVYTGLAAIVVLGVGAQWVARRFGFPALLLLLPAGLAAGPVLGLVDPEKLFGDLLYPAVTLAVALLLFQSGLGLRVADLAEGRRRPVFGLVTYGVAITFAGAASGAALCFGLSADLAVVLGAVLVVSGPTVVGPLLAASRVREPARSVLLWEGTVLDPLGALFGIVALNVVLANRSGIGAVGEVVLSLGVGLGVGVATAALLVLALARFLVTDDFEAPIGLLAAVAAFTVSELVVEESGLLAALVLGVALANQPFVSTRVIAGFGETLELLLIGSLFVVLGATIDMADLRAVALPLLPFVALLVLVVRPLAVAVSAARSTLDRPTRLFAAWLAPRGIVAAATSAQFAIQLQAGGIEAGPFAAIAFGVVLGTGVVYGLTSPLVARRLGLAESAPTGVAIVGEAAWLADLARGLRAEGVDAVVVTAADPLLLACAPDVPSVLPDGEIESFRAAFESHRIGRLLVATTDEMVDEVVTATGIELLGRANVYCAERSRPEGTVDRMVHGTRQAFAPGATLAAVAERVADGGRIETVSASPADGDLLLVGVTEGGVAELGPGRPGAKEPAAWVAVVGAAPAAGAPRT